MAVNIDKVYQKVLAITNKEQRGYITPQEFNLLADKAQLEIFDSYFHDLKTAHHKPTPTNTSHADEIEMIQEKLSSFKVISTINFVFDVTDETISTISLPTNLYYLDTILDYSSNVEISELTKKEVMYTENNPLTKATKTRPVFIREGGSTIRLFPTPTQNMTYSVHFWAKPVQPKWGYVVVRDTPLYNSNTSTNFSLHASEEEVLVSRILQLAGIVIMKPGIVEIGGADKMAIKQDQNN